jgi:hypothetical protein
MAKASLFYLDPTIDEMRQALAKDMPELDEFDPQAAIWWFAANNHEGQWTNLYAALCASEYRPGPLEMDCPDEAGDAYALLWAEFVPGGRVMSVFAKRHYEAIALAMQAARCGFADCDPQWEGIEIAIAELRRAFRRDSNRFDGERFERACVPGANVRARG